MAIPYAIEATESFFLRSGREAGFEMIFSDISIYCTRTPPRTILCSPLFQFFLGPAILLFALCLFCVALAAVVVSETVGVTIHGVDGSPVQRTFVFSGGTLPIGSMSLLGVRCCG